MKVMIGKYTYESDLALRVGDRVLLPTPDWLRDVKGPTWEGVVSQILSTATFKGFPGIAWRTAGSPAEEPSEAA